MTLTMKQELMLNVRLEYEVIDPRGACEVIACKLGTLDIWGQLDEEDQRALTEACEEDVQVREEEEAVERGLLAAEVSRDEDEGCF